MSNLSKSLKAPARPPFLTRTPRPEGLPEYFLCVRQAEASKLGLRAHGNITYQVLLDPERQSVFLRVIANSGSGSFSDEPVLVDKLAEAVANRDTSKPLRGSVLQTAIVGKSVCNSGFFAAVLVAENLLGREVGKRFDLTDLERWQTWMTEQRATAGELAEVRLKAEGVDLKKDKLVGKGVKGKGLDIVPATKADVATPIDADIDGGTDAVIEGPAGEASAPTAKAATELADNGGLDACEGNDPLAGEGGTASDTLSEGPSVPEEGHGSPEVDHDKAPTGKGRRRAKGNE